MEIPGTNVTPWLFTPVRRMLAKPWVGALASASGDQNAFEALFNQAHTNLKK